MKIGAQIAVVVILAIGSAAMADHDIADPYYAPEAVPTIDGDLSDWAGAQWIALDENYSGTPADLGDCAYSVSWSDDNNLVYLAASVVDTNQSLSDYFVAWNGQDDSFFNLGFRVVRE